MFAKSNGEHLFRFKRLGGEGKQSNEKNRSSNFFKTINYGEGGRFNIDNTVNLK